MAKRPFNPVIPNYTPRSERNKEVVEHFEYKPCIICGKKITEGYYGSWNDGGTCSRKCEMEQEKKPRFQPPSLEFLQQLEQRDGLNEGFESGV